MNHGSLFSGIGGFDLAAEWMGWNNIFHCEIEAFPREVLKYYWPKAISYEDIKRADFTIHRGKIDILTGGFPCQPFSIAGKRKGTADDRNLWPEMLRAIREIRPGYVVGENVFGITNWNGGMVFEQVQADLEAEGYEVQPFILPSAGVNAPHKRDRVWFAAYAGLQRQEKRQKQTVGIDQFCKKRDATNTESKRLERENRERMGKTIQSSKQSTSNTERKRQQEQRKPERSLHKETNGEWKASWSYYDGRWPAQPPICGGNDGISRKLDGITFPKWRNESIKAYGNAIVPQVAFEIFKAVEKNFYKK